MPAPSIAPYFDPKRMNEALDLSQADYSSLLKQHREDEERRALEKAERQRTKNVWERFLDSLIPA